MRTEPTTLDQDARASVDAVQAFIREVERVPEGHRSPVFLAGTIQLALLLLTTDLRADRGETEPELRLALTRSLLSSVRHFAAELGVDVQVGVTAPARPSQAPTQPWPRPC